MIHLLSLALCPRCAFGVEHVPDFEICKECEPRVLEAAQVLAIKHGEEAAA